MRSTTGAWTPPASVSRQAAPVSDSVIPALTAVWLTWKSSGLPTSWPCGASSAILRSGPPRDWPTDSSAMRADPAPAKARTPRREIVGSAGATATRYPASSGSGRVLARLVRSSAMKLRLRSALTIAGSLMTTWTTKPAMNTHAP
jgi:hypothetical protein